MTNRAEWQGAVGDVWADEWRRTDRSFTELQAVLVERAAALAASGGHIIDIGCGAGDTSLALAGRLPEARIFGIDISESLIAVARQRADGDPRLTFAVADAATYADPAFRPDLLVSRHGVMFFDDPIAAFTSLRAAAVPDANLVFSCFRSPDENEWASALAVLVPGGAKLEGTGPGPFAFADVARVAAILQASGWSGIAHEAVDFAYVTGGGVDPLADALGFFSRIGPAARAARELDGTARAAFLGQLEAMLRSRLSGNKIAFNAAAWIWTASKKE
ncbi:MAG TPA: methyltransferase domain-containing protein [Sphingorhabdus sp.]|nr:methyltransferase domain-containing protein [Sphingorhabdus sp.]